MTNATKKKIKILFLVLTVLSLFMYSCGFEDEYSGDPTASRPTLNSAEENENSSRPWENSEKHKEFNALEGYDYQARKFVIVTTDDEFFNAKDEKSLLGKAISSRNEMVETKFNIQIEVKVQTPSEIIENATSYKSKGKFYADLIVAPADVQAELMNRNVLLNLNVLPFFEGSDKLYSASQINGKTYLLFNSLTQVENSAWCVFYNEVMANRLGKDPYELYKKGEWTWEAFLDFSERAAELTTNGYVATCTNDELINVFWASTGNKFFGETANSPLELPSVSGSKEILSSIRKVVNSDSLGKIQGFDALEAFISGDSAMLLCQRSAVYEICDSKMDWKAVPMPKYNEESQHFAYIDKESLAASVPSGTIDSDFVGRIINALVLASEITISENVTTNEIYYYWDSNETALMMEEVKNNLHLDIGLIYASAVKDIATVTTENLKSSFDANIPPFQFYHSTKRQFQLYAAEHFG